MESKNFLDRFSGLFFGSIVYILLLITASYSIHSESMYGLFAAFLLLMSYSLFQVRSFERVIQKNDENARLLNDASEGIAILKEGKIFSINTGFEKMFNVRREDAKGQPVTNFFFDPIEDLNLQNTHELFGMKRGGENLPIEISVRDSDLGEEIQYITVKDLTERRRSQHLKLEKDIAEQANHAKSVFLAKIAHEMRTPLHGIMSFARFGVKDADLIKNMEIKDYFQEILDSGRRLMMMLDENLDLAKLEAGKMSYKMANNNLSKVANRVVSEMSAFAQEKKINLTIKSYNTHDLSTKMDPYRMSQVVRNLISNSIKYSDPNSEVKLELLNVNNEIVFRIKNQGVQIPKEELEIIFDKFTQSSQNPMGVEGTGLGLAICREIVQHHGGHIWAENLKDGWVQFSFALPLKPVREVKRAA